MTEHHRLYAPLIEKLKRFRRSEFTGGFIQKIVLSESYSTFISETSLSQNTMLATPLCIDLKARGKKKSSWVNHDFMTQRIYMI
jgi:hypothetical protein